MPLVSASFSSLLEPGLRKIFIDQYELLPEMRPSLYNISEIDTSYYKDQSVGAFTPFAPFNGSVNYQEAFQNFEVTYRPVAFSDGFKVQRELFDDDLYGAIARLPKNLASAAVYTMEGHAAQLFNNAFTGSGTINLDGIPVLVNTEGNSLCATAHNIGKANSLTFSNSDTLALTAVNVEAKRVAMARTPNDRGNVIAITPDLLLVPREKEQAAFEVIATAGKVDSAENNANFHYGRYKLAVWDRLESTTNWFFIDSMHMKDWLLWHERIPLEFFRHKDFDSLVAKFACYMRYAFGWSDWRWISGSQASS